MRIAFSGAACTGKTTTLNAFLQRWPMYNKPPTSYRSLITDSKHSKNTTKKLQKKILQFMLDQQKEYTPHDKVVYDRCGLDNIVYSLWAMDKGIGGFTESFVSTCIEMVKESMRHLDVIFLMTRDEMDPVVESNSVREVDPAYVNETDNLFKAIYNQYANKGASPFFPQNDSPALIHISGTTSERLEQISLYVNADGNMFGEEQSLINAEEISKMEKLVREQRDLLSKEKGILPKY